MAEAEKHADDEYLAKHGDPFMETVDSQQLRNKSQSKKGPRILASSESG